MHEVFESATIAGIPLTNRILRSATHEGLSDAQGQPTEACIKLYERLAKGGVGAIITGYVGIMDNGKSPLYNMAMLDNDQQLPAFKTLVDRVHAQDTPIILQLAHCGRQTRSKITGFPTVAPSAIRDGMYREDKPHALSDSEISDIISHFTAAIERSKKAGFDGVQLHLAHGYLLASFLSPHMNKRTDHWGGSTENRFRIVKEILQQARAIVGDYPILAKINAYEKSADGMQLEEAIVIAKYLEKYGCDAIEVSNGIIEDGFWFSRGDFPFNIIVEDNFRLKHIPVFLRPLIKPVLEKQLQSPQPYSLFNLNSAEQIRKAVNIPVIVVGGIRKLSEIRDIIENDRCDFVSMAKPLIIEPNLVQKFKTGAQMESKCINCNYCVIGIEARPLKCYYGRTNSFRRSSEKDHF